MKAQPSIFAGWLVSFLVLGILAVFGTMYLTDQALYDRIIELWGFGNQPHLFFDAEYISNEITCWERGVDVYFSNPCDPLNRPHVYSPLWLRLSFINLVPGRVFGLIQDLAYAASLTFLPGPKRMAQFGIMAAAILSPTVMFALERSNVDLSMFVLAIIGIGCLERSWPVRGFGYTAFLAAAMLKFYPIVLFARALSERPTRLLGIAAASTLIVATTGFAYWHEIRRALHNVPVPSPFGDGFSSHQLGDGLAFLTQQPAIARPIWIGMTALAFVVAGRNAFAPAFRNAFDALSPRALNCLTAGALLFCGCFLAGPSVGYRGTFLLLVLPGLMAIEGTTPDKRLRSVARVSLVATLFSMWNLGLMRRLWPTSSIGKALGSSPFLGVWFVREIMWWIVFTALLTVIMRSVWVSRTSLTVRSRVVSY